jgi:hypothetical protein
MLCLTSGYTELHGSLEVIVLAEKCKLAAGGLDN